MKKRLLGIALLFAMIFALTACGGYTPPDYGEKGYVANFYTDIGYDNSEAPKKALITSTKELKEYRKTVQFGDIFFWNDGDAVNRETEYTKLMDQFDAYSSRYFKDNALVAILQTASSGSNSYKVKSVAAQDGTLNVALQCWIPLTGTTDIKVWCILIECPKGDYKKLDVEVEDKYQTQEATGNAFYVSFTHEASLETVYHDYTPADFPELDFAFTVEDHLSTVTNFVRQALAQESIDSQAQYRIDNYIRGLKFTLAEPSKENVLRAVELFSEREDVWLAYPDYEQKWPQE